MLFTVNAYCYHIICCSDKNFRSPSCRLPLNYKYVFVYVQLQTKKVKCEVVELKLHRVDATGDKIDSRCKDYLTRFHLIFMYNDNNNLRMSI